MPTVAEFFAESHRGNAFGVKGPLYGLAGHRGDDTKGWRAGTAIPWIGTGIVVRSEYQAGLGWVVTLWDANQRVYISNCHMQSKGVAVGKRIRYVGEYAGPIGNTGTLSLGVHDHVVVSRTSSNPASGSVIDPRPFINAAKIAQAGGGVTPLPDDPAALAAPEKGMNMVSIIRSEMPAGMADADPRTVLLKSFFGGAALSSFGEGKLIVAKLGDAPGTFANVQVAQADEIVNGWIADHCGEIPGLAKQEARLYDFGTFLALCQAYLQPVNVSGGTGAGAPAGPVDISPESIAALAQASAVAFFAEQKKPGN